MNFTDIKKSFNTEFLKATVKAEGTDGKYRPVRDGYDKLIRRIPTYVQLSPMDCTSVKSDKIEAKFQEMISFLKRHGGILQTKSTQHAIVEFTNSKGKQLRVSFFLEKYRASYLYDEGYKTVVFDVMFEKI